MNKEEIKQKVGEAFLHSEIICIHFRDNTKTSRWCIVKSVNAHECVIKFDTLLDDGLFVTASAVISYNDISKVYVDC